MTHPYEYGAVEEVGAELSWQKCPSVMVVFDDTHIYAHLACAGCGSVVGLSQIGDPNAVVEVN